MPGRRMLATTLSLIVLPLAPGRCAPGDAGEPAGPEAILFTRVTEGPAATDRASTGSGQWIDVDEDDDLDLFVANGYDVSARAAAPQRDRIYMNDGTGRLLSDHGSPLASDTAYSSGATWGDYDNDGRVDVFVPAQRGQENLLYRNVGASEGAGNRGPRSGSEAAFVPEVEGPPVEDGGLSFSASWVDVDGDGHLDLHVSNGGLAAVATALLYRNRGDGTFERAPPAPFTTDSAAYRSPTWADYDDDGDPDLFAARGWSPKSLTNGLYRNDGGWTFTSIDDSPASADTVSTYSAAWGDYDNDGDLDLAVGARGMNPLYRNEGGGRFVRVTEGGPHLVDGGDTYSIHWADYDNDADLDLLAANWGSPSFLCTNLGDGNFERRVHGDLGRLPTHAGGASWGDYDGDGDLDLYLANWPNFPGANEENHLYRNDSSAENRWLGVRLEGTRSNRSAIGARIRVRARIRGEKVWQTREVAGQTGFRSQDPLRQHFGLGDAEEAEVVEVRWPSGLREVFRGLAAGEVHGLREGEGAPLP